MRVSVAIITYNQEAYIAEALSSVLEQETDFDYEIRIGEDCSTDRTGAIVREFQAAHPETIRIETADHNVGALANSRRTLAACRGEYIALLDGDDYWSRRDKLRRQVAFLDAHPECSMCFCTAEIRCEGEPDVHFYPPGRKASYTIEDLLRENFIASCTPVFRKSALAAYPPWFAEVAHAPGDWLLALLLARQGRIGYIDELMAVYRLHEGGLWSALLPAQRIESRIAFLRHIDRELGFAYTPIIRRRIRGLRLRLLMARHLPFLVPLLLAARQRLLRSRYRPAAVHS